MLVLPLTSDPSRFFATDLGGATYTIETRYNDRSASWTFDVTRDLDEVRLVSGVPLLLGQEMLSSYALKIGGLIAADLSNTGADAGPDDLGERLIVVYVTEDELALMAAAGVPGLGVTQ